MSAPRPIGRDRDAPYLLPHSTCTTPSCLPSNHPSPFLADFVSLVESKPIARLGSRGRAA